MRVQGGLLLLTSTLREAALTDVRPARPAVGREDGRAHFPFSVELCLAAP